VMQRLCDEPLPEANHSRQRPGRVARQTHSRAEVEPRGRPRGPMREELQRGRLLRPHSRQPPPVLVAIDPPAQPLVHVPVRRAAAAGKVERR
jgi:hypothetical protein